MRSNSQPVGQAHRLGHRLRVVGEQGRHLRGGAQHRAAVAAPLGLRAVEGQAVADRHEGVLHQGALGGVRVGIAGRHARHPGARGQSREVPRQAPVPTRAGVLDLHEDAPRPEVAHQVAHGLLGLPPPPARHQARHQPLARAAGEAHQPLGVGRQRGAVEGRGERAAVGRGAGVDVGEGEEPAEVGVPARVLGQQRQVGAPAQGDLRPGDGPHPGRPGGVGELERSAQPVVIREGQGRVPQLSRPGRHLIGSRGAVQEAEGRVGVELGVGR